MPATHKRMAIGWLALAVFALAPGLWAQPAARVSGTVTAVDKQALTVKTDGGESIAVLIAPEIRVQRVMPGERDLSKAEAITFGDIAVGDRVLARGSRSDATIQASSLIVMTARAIAQKNEAETKAWHDRGMFGVVQQVDEPSREIKIVARVQGTEQPAAITVTEKTVIRRYAPDSVRFSDAALSKISEIRKGDQLRVMGDKDASGARMTAEQIVFGTFRTIAGTVSAISPGENTVTVKDIQTGRTLIVHTKHDSQLKKFAMQRPPMGMMGGNSGFPGRTSGGPGTGAPGGEGARGGFRSGGTPDIGAMLDRLPATTLEEIKTGETVIVSSTSGAKLNEVTAIVLLSGAEPIIAQLTARAESRRGQDPLAGGSSLDRGLEGMMGMPVQ